MLPGSGSWNYSYFQLKITGLGSEILSHSFFKLDSRADPMDINLINLTREEVSRLGIVSKVNPFGQSNGNHWTWSCQWFWFQLIQVLQLMQVI